MDEPEYKITEQDTLVMLKALRHVAPEHATPEKAIFILDQLHIRDMTTEDLTLELITEILKDFVSH